MGYRCRWQTIGRAEPAPKPATTADQRIALAQYRVTPVPRRKTFFDVRDPAGELLGQVRTTFAGQAYRPADAREWLWAGSQWASDDPPHCLAILALVEG